MTSGGTYMLPAGHRILGRYEVVEPVAVGVGGVRYAARTGDARVEVEEYLPARLAVREGGTEVVPSSPGVAGEFASGLEAFLAAARRLAAIGHDGLVEVHECLLANGTGYVVTADVAGETVAELAARLGRLGAADALRPMRRLIEGLVVAHDAGVIHRQIHPGAIVVGADGTGVLRGFGYGVKTAGGPRRVFEQRPTRLADVTPGYSALEQYSAGGREGPWTDIYALGAVMYRCVTGLTPPDAPSRAVRDDLVALGELPPGADEPGVGNAIDAALAVPIAARPQNVAVWQSMLFGDTARTRARARVGRTSARGFGQLTAPRAGGVRSGGVPGGSAGASERGRLMRWSVPALAATVLMALVTWIDTGVLRDAEADSPTDAAAGNPAAPGTSRHPEFSDTTRARAPAPTMVRLPGAECAAGACDGRPGQEGQGMRTVAFGLGKYEVTEAEFEAFAADRGLSWRPRGASGRRPAVGVSWVDAAGYATWLSAKTGRDYRLPTEAEWEYGARAGRERLALRAGPPATGAMPVGTGQANPWGLHDMDGNVAEWVLDCGDGGGTGPDAAERACERRVTRGSSWRHPQPNGGAATRTAAAARERALDVGFRVAATLDE